MCGDWDLRWYASWYVGDEMIEEDELLGWAVLGTGAILLMLTLMSGCASESDFVTVCTRKNRWEQGICVRYVSWERVAMMYRERGMCTKRVEEPYKECCESELGNICCFSEEGMECK